MDKKSPLVLKLKEWIDGEYASGRQTALSTNELEAKIAELSEGQLVRRKGNNDGV